MPDENAAQRPAAADALLNPMVLIPILILFSVFFVIGSAIFGMDRGVMNGMSKIEYARGLITYLFAVVTTGTAVVLVVFALSGRTDQASKDRFDRGKEVLSLLLGVFGTMVGFYFGSEIGRARGDRDTVRVAPMRLAQSAGKIGLSTFVSGGSSPYRYSILVGSRPLGAFEEVAADGWINREFHVPAVVEGQSLPITLQVQDSEERIARQTAVFVSRAPATASGPE